MFNVYCRCIKTEFFVDFNILTEVGLNWSERSHGEDLHNSPTGMLQIKEIRIHLSAATSLIIRNATLPIANHRLQVSVFSVVTSASTALFIFTSSWLTFRPFPRVSMIRGRRARGSSVFSTEMADIILMASWG